MAEPDDDDDDDAIGGLGSRTETVRFRKPGPEASRVNGRLSDCALAVTVCVKMRAYRTYGPDRSRNASPLPSLTYDIYPAQQ